eukprot:gene7066-7861_t
MQARIKRVNLDFQASTCPKIVHFENGCLKNDAENVKRMKFDLYQQNSNEDSTALKRFLTAESKNMTYIGKKKEQLCNYYLGVFDSDTQQLEIHHANVFNLHPSLIDDNNKITAKENIDIKQEESFIEKSDKLVEAFGSSKQKRALSARKKNLVDKNELNSKITQVAGKVELVESEDVGNNALTPPINLEASTPAQLYNIKHSIQDIFYITCRHYQFFPKRMKDKALCYILVLAIIIDEFTLDCTLLMKDLKLGPARISNHLKAIGCVVETKKQKKDPKQPTNTASVTIATLKVPLPKSFLDT